MHVRVWTCTWEWSDSEARKGCHIPWSWSYRQLWVAWHRHWELNLDLFQEKYVLLTDEPFSALQRWPGTGEDQGWGSGSGGFTKALTSGPLKPRLSFLCPTGHGEKQEKSKKIRKGPRISWLQKLYGTVNLGLQSWSETKVQIENQGYKHLRNLPIWGQLVDWLNPQRSLFSWFGSQKFITTLTGQKPGIRQSWELSWPFVQQVRR